jgi:4'-phosphopantetheinyl transferase
VSTSSGGPDDSARAARVERRSPTRPVFKTGWRKALARAFTSEESPAAATDDVARVDVWLANPAALISARSCLTVLSPDDWAAINRVRDPNARRSAIASRVLLRIGLSKAVEHKVPPTEWRFTEEARGRRVVADGLPNINFSVSHSDEFVGAAISPTLDVGIDIECVDQNIDKSVIADFCHLDEFHAVGGLPRPQEIREFVRLWTLKEAYAKMIGLGHTLDFRAVKFTLDPVVLVAAGDENNPPAQFETFYVSEKHVLFHVSLAMRNRAAGGATEIQVITLTSTERKDASEPGPSEQFR